MYTLFNNAPPVGSTNLSTIDLDYVKRAVLDDQVARYKEYRRQTPGYIKSDHLLLKILNSLMVEFDGDLMTYHQRVSGIVNRLAGSMGLSNASHHGRVFDKGYFYGDDISEIYITASEGVTGYHLWNNWERMSAVRVLSHPCTGTAVLELDGELKVPPEFKNKANVAVIELNIPLLACQYQLWKMSMRASTVRPEVIPDSYFISSIVLPNMLLSHLDISVLNTLSWLSGMDGFFEPKSNMPFYTTDHTGRFEKGLEEIIRRYGVQTFTFPEMLRNIPCFGAETLLDAVKVPAVAYTNQVVWALTAARLPLTAWLLKMNSINENAKNDLYINRFKRSLIEAESGKYLVNQIPNQLAEYFKGYINTFLVPYLYPKEEVPA